MNQTHSIQDLNDIMEIGHVIEIRDGKAQDPVVPTSVIQLWAPELFWENGTHVFEAPAPGWSLMDGYSGQYGYSGPIMHESEFIGGRLEQDILARDGYYVALVCYVYGEDEDDVAGWAVAYRAPFA